MYNQVFNTVSHFSIVYCWCEEKNINPTKPGY